MKFRSHYSSSGGNLYTVEEPGHPVLLLECGVSIKKIRRALDGVASIADLAGCLVTHAHGDHAHAAEQIMRAGINVYASAETLTELRLEGHRASVVRPKTAFNAGPWRVLPFEVRHDVEGSLGFLVMSPREAKLLFVMDTRLIPHRFVNLDVIAIECNYCDDLLRESDHWTKRRVQRWHMGLTRALKFLGTVDMKTVSEIHLLHVSDAHGDTERMRREVEAATGRPTYVAAREPGLETRT